MSGAASAYRGYRLQALYCLYRILSSTDKDLVFQPEGFEDLAVFDGDRLIEVVQVKARGSLALSDVVSRQLGDGSFLHRVNNYLQQVPPPRIKLVSFYPLGQELRGGLDGEEGNRQEVVRKLVEQYAFSLLDAEAVVTAIEAIEVGESALVDDVYKFLHEAVTGADPGSSFDLLNQWLYGCAERCLSVTRQDVIERVNAAGRFSAKLAAGHNVWFRTVVPIEGQKPDEVAREALNDEFYRGVGARYEHVLANLDVPRPAMISRIEAAFAERNAVVLHGASGQGKTTLALRYVHDALRDHWPYQVLAVENRAQAHEIGAALEGFADALGVRMTVFFDVSPQDDGWTDLVERLARHPRIRLLVSIREEDWRRATIADSDALRDVDMALDEAEAEHVYGSLAARRWPANFLDFSDAWQRFEGQGPLLEFVYLVTQGASLRELLAKQVARLKREANSGQRPKELELLRSIAIASAYGARVKVKALAEHLALPALDEVIDRLENEYLIRRAEDRAFLEGLHPVRLTILVSLLTDPDSEPWSRTAQSVLSLIDERDLQSFLLHSFSRRSQEIRPLLEALTRMQPESWTGVVGVIRSLVWLGLREYADANRSLIDDARCDSGPGWWVVLDGDLLDAMPGVAASTWDSLGDMVTPERRLQIDALRARQTPKGDAFIRVSQWVHELVEAPRLPASVEEWQAAAESVFWAGHLGHSWSLPVWLPTDSLTDAIGRLPLAVVADLVVGVAEGYGPTVATWLDASRPSLVERFQRETMTLVLEDDGDKVTAHFVIEPDPLSEAAMPDAAPRAHGSNPLHDEALVRINLMRRLFPDRKSYACQGYGHGVATLGLPHDDTTKTGISRHRLPSEWLVSANSTFGGLVTFRMRPGEWEEYADQVLALREEVIRCLEDLTKALPMYLGSSRSVGLLPQYIPALEWYRRWKILREPPLLPSCAVDEWGFVYESLRVTAEGGANVAGPTTLSRVASLRRYRAMLVPLQDYTRAWHNFLLQAPGVMKTNGEVQKHKGDHVRRLTRRGNADRQGEVADRRLSTANLADAWKALPELQRQFRLLLGRFVDEERLNSVERHEAGLFAAVWPTWYAFALQPSMVLHRPVHDAVGRLSTVTRRLQQALRRELSTISSASTQASVLSEDVRWESEPVLWLLVDGIDGVEVYSALAAILEAVRRAVRSVEDTELRRYALEFVWRYVVIVPTVRGRSLMGWAWRVHTNILVKADSVESLGWWLLTPVPIPSKALSEVGVPVWDDPRLAVGARLVTTARRLLPPVVHVAELAALPNLNDVGEDLGLRHVEEMSERVSREAQSLFDTGSEMTTAIADFVVDSSSNQAESLGVAVDALSRLYEVVLPSAGHQQMTPLAVSQFGPWAARLRDGLGNAEIANLAWASAVLG